MALGPAAILSPQAGLRGGVAVFLAVVVLLAGCTSESASSTGSAGSPPASTATSVAPVSTATDLEAVTVMETFFDRFNAGDADGLLELLAEDVVMTGFIAEEFVHFVLWDIAQGTRITDHRCERGPITDDGVQVVCDFELRPYLAEAVGAPASMSTVHATVSESGLIVFYNERSANPTLDDVNRRFDAWMETYHPQDAEAVSCCGWPSETAASASGAIRKGYADEYAAFLAANGCDFEDACDS